MTQRPIRFRGYDRVAGIWMFVEPDFVIDPNTCHMTCDYGENDRMLMQSTGLHDKNGLAEVWEGDILNSDGKLIGNRYENEILLQDPANLLIEGMGTKAWRSTEQTAMERGCEYSQ